MAKKSPQEIDALAKQIVQDKLDSMKDKPLPQINTSPFLATERGDLGIGYELSKRMSSYSKDAADNTWFNNKIIDRTGAKKDVPSDYKDGFEPWLGYNGMVYKKELEQEASDRMPEKASPFQVMTGKKELKDENDSDKVYSWLVPSYDPDDYSPILKEFIGTKKELDAANEIGLKKYGFAKDEDGIIQSFLKGGMSTLGATDDMLLGALHLVTTPFDIDNKLGIDKLHQEVMDDTEDNGVISSKEAGDFGTLDWFSSGFASGLASLAQFGGVGRGLRAGVGLAEIAGAFGKEGLKNEAKKALADQIVSYGASGIVGFGYGFNEAKQNGLEDGEAALFGTTVGAINAMIETKMGPGFDRFLTGGGTKAISRVLRDDLKAIGGDVTAANMKKLLVENKAKYYGIAESLYKSAVPEGAEEVAQTFVEQTSRATYNFLFADENALEGQGKFADDQFNFTELVSAGIFGMSSAAPFGLRMRKDDVTAMVMDGKAAEVKMAADKMLAMGQENGGITKDQHRNIVNNVNFLNDVYLENKEALDTIVQKGAPGLRGPLIDLLAQRSSLQAQIDKETDGLADQPDINVLNKAKEAITKLQDKQKAISAQIGNFSDKTWLDSEIEKYNKAKEAIKDSKDNMFEQLMAVGGYNSYHGIDEVEDAVSKYDEANANHNMFNTLSDFFYGVMLYNNGTSKNQDKLKKLLTKEIKAKGIHLSGVFRNNDVMRKFYTDEMGIDKMELPASDAEIDNAKADPAITANRHLAEDDFQKMIATPEVDEMARKANKDFDKLSEEKKFEARLTAFYNNLSKFNHVNPLMLASLDNRDLVQTMLSGDQAKVLRNLMGLSQRSASLVLHDVKNTEAAGLFSNSTGMIHVYADVSRIQELLAKKSRTAAEQKELDSRQEDLFHKVAHEFGHNQFNEALGQFHSMWKDAKKLGKATPQSVFFDRLLALVVLSDKMLRDRKKTGKDLYFLRVMDDFYSLPGNKRDDANLNIVREFFAEALSNKAFQKELDSFDLADKSNESLVKSLYNYKQPTGVKKSILSEVVDAFKSVFTYFNNIFSKQERTLLREAMVLGSRIVVNERTPIGVGNPRANYTYAYDMSVNHFGMISIFDGSDDQIKGDELATRITENMRLAGKGVKSGFIDNLQKHFSPAFETSGNIDFKSVKVIHFDNTDGILIAWNTINEDGTLSSNRYFVNKHGKRTFVNSNPSNTESAVTLAKHDIFYAFNNNPNDVEFKERRELINNFERASREGFSGETVLELDENRSWSLNGKKILGQINIVYRFGDGTTAIIGYAPDLTKPRLARMIKNGAVIKVKVSNSKNSPGSKAYVKKDENGNLTHVLNVDYDKISEEEQKDYEERGYSKARVGKASQFHYLPESNVSQEVIQDADQIDDITNDDPTKQPDLSSERIASVTEIIAKGIRHDEEVSDDISFYSNDTNVDDDKSIMENREFGEQIEYIREALKRKITRLFFFRSDMTADETARMINSYLDESPEKPNPNLAKPYLRKLFPDMVDVINNLGFATKEKEVEWINNMVQELYEQYGHALSQPMRRDAQDWTEQGKNPSHNFAEGIKIDLESLSYSWEGKKMLVDFNDAKNILFDASQGTDNWDEMISQLQRLIEDEVLVGEEAVIAKIIYNHYTRDRSQSATKEDKKWNDVKASIWSQFASYKKTNNYVLSPDGDTVRYILGGASAEVSKEQSGMLSNIMKVADGIKEKLKASGLTGDEANKFIDNEIAKGNKITNAKGNDSTVIAIMNGFKSKLLSKRNPETGKFDPRQEFISLLTSNSISDQEYKQIVDYVIDFYSYLGVDISRSMLERKRNKLYDKELERRTKEYAEQFRIEGLKANKVSEKSVSEETIVKRATEKAEAKALKELESVPQYNVKQVKYDGYRFNGAKNVSALQLLLHAADYLNSDLRIYLGLPANYTKKKTDAISTIKELKIISELMLAERSNVRSGDFYFDPQFNKRWSYKIKSFTDDLFERLQKPASKLLKRYSKAAIYKHNTVLESMAESNGEPIEITVSGLKSYTDDNGNTIYQDAGDMDFMFMHLASFIATGNKFGESDTYFHIDDVPSDKPNVLAYRLKKFGGKEIKMRINDILETEKVRLERAEAKFEAAFAFGPNDGEFVIRDQSLFNDLIPKVHYKIARTENNVTYYKKGDMYNTANYFYDGKSADEIMKQITSEAEAEYKKWSEKGLKAPVSQYFEDVLKKDLADNVITQKEFDMKLNAERKRLFTEWTFNYTVNRYHLSMLNMGDYMYYKSGDEFSDLNKRKAGPAAPRQANMLERSRIKMVAMKDVGITDDQVGESELEIHELIEDENGNLVPQVKENTIASNRTDAQGYITEAFAEELKKSYGDFSGYDKIFKPVLFGVDEERIADARPLYLKLSLAVMPDPGTDENPKNVEYFAKYPKQKEIARKIYKSGTDIVVFESGIKVGISHVNQLSDNDYLVQEISARQFGIQNNPYHDPFDDESVISGLVQLTKQLGDNDPINEEIMRGYHQIEADRMEKDVMSFWGDMSNPTKVKDMLKESLESSDHSAAMAKALDHVSNPLDHPLFATQTENLVNSELKHKVSLVKRSGEKLVNVSELGFQRPELEDDQIQKRIMMLQALGYSEPADFEYNSELRWTGPRKPNELTFNQLDGYFESLQSGRIPLSKEKYILDDNGNPQIFGADVIVPDTGKYSIGDNIIATRIPTSKKGSVVAGEVVGFTSPSQGNVIVVGKHGPGIIGFDFDIDGFFVWKRDPNGGEVNDMFDKALRILLHPVNYNEVTSPTVTSTIKGLVDKVQKLIPAEAKGSKVNRFSPFRQINLKKLNSIGKEMIGISAMWYGIHSMLAQSKSSLNGKLGYAYPANTKTKEGENAQFDVMEGEVLPILQAYNSTYINQSGNEVKVTDIFSELINASTDNAKLQLLGQLNINPDTAPVLMDMVSHGIDFEFAILLINQPIIREYVEMKETQDSASFRGEKKDAFQHLLEKYESKIAETTNAPYKFYDEDKKGKRKKEDIIYRKKGQGYDKADRYLLSHEQLESGISSNGQESLAELENQLYILEKFKYYGELANVTSGIGALITLTSSFPKTAGEAINRMNKIESTGLNTDKPKINTTLDTEHPTYRLLYGQLNRLIDFYKGNKLYFKLPGVFEKHLEMFGSSGGDKQDSIVKDFYNFILTSVSESDNKNGKYNFSTTSWNGKEIDPFHFVHYSSYMVKSLQDKFPDNEFLALLTVKENKKAKLAEIQDKKGDPNYVTASLLYDPAPNQLERIQKAFDELPDNFTFSYEIGNSDGTIGSIEQTVASTKDVLLGHLLHTKGMQLGGFSFSKVLPVSVHANIDQQIEAMDREMKAMHEAHVENMKSQYPAEVLDKMSEDERALLDQQIYESSPVIKRLTKYFTMVQLNSPDLIKNVSKEDQDMLMSNQSGERQIVHPLYKPNNGYHRTGVILRKKNADMSESGSLWYDKFNPEVMKLANYIVNKRGGLFKMRDLNGIERIYEIYNTVEIPYKGFNGKTYKHKLLEFRTVKYTNNKNVKQFSWGNPDIIFNEAESAALDEKEYAEEVRPKEIQIINGVETIDGLSVTESVMKNVIPLAGINAVGGSDAILDGKKKGLILTEEEAANIDDNTLIAVQKSEDPNEGFILVRTIPGKLHRINDMAKSFLLRNPDGKGKVIDALSEITGIDKATSESLMESNDALVQFEPIMIIDGNGDIVKWAKKFDPKSVRIQKYEQGMAEQSPDDVSNYSSVDKKASYKPKSVPAGFKNVPSRGIKISDQQLNVINANLEKAGFPAFTINAINNLTDARKQKTLECYGQ